MVVIPGASPAMEWLRGLDHQNLQVWVKRAALPITLSHWAEAAAQAVEATMQNAGAAARTLTVPATSAPTTRTHTTKSQARLIPPTHMIRNRAPLCPPAVYPPAFCVMMHKLTAQLCPTPHPPLTPPTTSHPSRTHPRRPPGCLRPCGPSVRPPSRSSRSRALISAACTCATAASCLQELQRS